MLVWDRDISVVFKLSIVGRIMLYVWHNMDMYLYPDYDDVINFKHFPRYWPPVRGIQWSPVNSPHKGQ